MWGGRWERGKGWLKIAQIFLGTRLGEKYVILLVWKKILASFSLNCSDDPFFGAETWQEDICIRDVLFATQRNVRPNLLLVNCYLQLGVETFKSQTTGGSVMSDHVLMPLRSSQGWLYHCASLCSGWSCVSRPCPAELTPYFGLAMLLSANSISACHPRSVFWSQIIYLHPENILAWTRVELAIPPVAQWPRGGHTYRMWLALFNFCLWHRKLGEDRGKPRFPLPSLRK